MPSERDERQVFSCHGKLSSYNYVDDNHLLSNAGKNVKRRLKVTPEQSTRSFPMQQTPKLLFLELHPRPFHPLKVLHP